MKQFNTILIFILCCLISVPVFGQRKKRGNRKAAKQVYAGYVITSNHNDTLFGEIQFLNPTYNQETVVFYNEEGEKTQYYPADGGIREYGFEYKKYNKATKSMEPLWFVYVRKLVEHEGEKGGVRGVFLERQIDGEITLYNYFALETSRINSRTYSHNYFVDKKGIDGFELVKVTRENYRSTVREYLVLGNDEIEGHLGTSGYGYKYLSTIVSLQNAWLTGNPQYEILLSSVRID
ncbi:MAG: hypothetical protein ACI97N_001180 [Cognaticolwellia sp.]|jgi:hypothetical protein